MIRRPLSSIRGKLLLTFLFFVIVPTLVIFWSYSRSSKDVIAHEVYDANQELADRSALTANDTATRMIKALGVLESDFRQYYGDGLSNWTSNYSDYLKVVTLQRRLISIRDLLLDSDAFIIFADYKELAVSTLFSFDMKRNYPVLLQAPWFMEGKSDKGFPRWTIPFRLDPQLGNNGAASGTGYMALSRSLHDPDISYDFGIALVGVRLDSIFPAAASSDAAGDGAEAPALLWDGGDSVIGLDGNPVKTLSAAEKNELRQKPEAIKRLELQNQRYMVNVSAIPALGDYALHLVPQKQFLNQLNRNQNQSLALIAVVFGIGLMLFVFFLLRFTKPIYSFLRSMNQVGAGRFETSVDVRGSDEIALLGSHFNRMVARLREAMDRLHEEQRQKEEAHFQSLQAQINPHFLFNTLNSIKLMAMLSNTNRNVSDMITALGKLLEFSMKMNQRYVTLAQEIEYLELYLSLQKIRYRDQIEIAVRVPQELRQLYVLKFTLQPLIENSIIHGKRFPLHIEITAEIAAGQLRVHLRDDGVGVAREQLAGLQEQLVQPHAKYSGIGLMNVDRRIKLYFGPGYGLSLSSQQEAGLAVTVALPVRMEPPL